MSQATNPSIATGQTGTAYRTQDNDRYAAALTQHSGSTRPSYAVAGTLWLDTSGTPWILKMYDGADDISVGTVNASTNTFNASNAASTGSTIAMTAAINETGATVASASTTDIGAAAGNYISVTGTTTITALGTVQVGTRRTVQFAGSLTLTHNGTSLILPGAANITTAAGDVATFISLGSGNWFCASYLRAASAVDGVAMLGAAQTFTKAQRGAVYTLTDASTVAWDLSLGNDFEVQLGGNRTLGVPTSGAAGQSGILIPIQGTTGSRTLAYSWCYGFAGGTAPTLTTTALAWDNLSYRVRRFTSATVTMTIATPGVVTWTGHGLKSGDWLQLTTTGALPTGLAASTSYWVSVVDANSFKLSTTKANAAAGTYIATSGSQSGTHTATCINIDIAPAKDFR